jgi:sporulation protein YlmC with PRC-barrel domain
MKRKYVHFELLLNHVVVDANGQKIGRIEEAEIEKRGGEWIVTAFVAGREGLAERLSVHHFGAWVLGFFGAHRKSPKPHRIPWEKLDLSDPEHPRLL